VSRAPGTLGRTQATAAPARSKRRPAAYARALDRVSAAWTMYSTRARTGCHSAARGLPQRPLLPCLSPHTRHMPLLAHSPAPQRTAWRHLTKASTNHIWHRHGGTAAGRGGGAEEHERGAAQDAAGSCDAVLSPLRARHARRGGPGSGRPAACVRACVRAWEGVTGGHTSAPLRATSDRPHSALVCGLCSRQWLQRAAAAASRARRRLRRFAQTHASGRRTTRRPSRATLRRKFPWCARSRSLSSRSSRPTSGR